MSEALERFERARRTVSQFEHVLRLFQEKGIGEVEQHAEVARRNRCECNQCFCCTARFFADRYWLAEHREAATRP